MAEIPDRVSPSTTTMAPLPQFIDNDRDVPESRQTKRRRLEMPSVADGFSADKTNAPRRQIIRPRVVVPKPKNLHVHPVPKPPTSNPKTTLKHVHPPSFSLPNTKPLHPPPPPPPPPPPIHNTPSSEHDKDLKTISTTSIGLLNSLSSSNGGEDLAAFLLPHRDHSTIATPTSRGIELSPEKRGKGHSPKFIRGGLAARASTLFNRAHTSLVLWQKETERRARTSSTPPDLTATIVDILHLPRPPRPNSKPSPVITLCRIHHQADSSYSYAPNQLYKIIFSLPQLSLDRFKQGITIRIFHPWHELSFTQPPSHNNVDSTSPQLHNRLPASLPLPLSPPSTPDLPINSTTALFCSRFIF